jgi:hypothetical protein
MIDSCMQLSSTVLNQHVLEELRRSGRLNLLVSQSFSIYMCRAIYNSKCRDYNTRIMLIIFPIYTLYNMPSQDEGGGTTWNLKRKIVKKAVKSGLVKTYYKLILEGDKTNLNLFLHNPILYKMIINLNIFCTSIKDRIHR